jgi:two-component system sensor histidine kinase DesK
VLAGDTRGAVSILDECAKALGEAFDELQASIGELRQRHETLRDVYSVGERMERRLCAAGVQVSLNFERLPLDPIVSDALAWICREATTNILKHSHARWAWLDLRAEGGAALLSIRDDGPGIASLHPASDDVHIGLKVMEERAKEVGGSLELSPGCECGVRIECRVPLEDGL